MGQIPDAMPTIRELVLRELRCGHQITHAEGGQIMALEQAQQERWAAFGERGWGLALPLQIDPPPGESCGADAEELVPTRLICSVRAGRIYPCYVVWSGRT